ncbi:hypothetical protein QR680_018419 [Steinernema hermaphroditum]|uniref:Uncharacterized protein n=1 Tax=Steinernema hermaphroditum TaxID=289476 RepID=A0AA39HIQ9_9BILA|nr:hypothetical protein QR680_018419 [Steinernema hermaphroditum]
MPLSDSDVNVERECPLFAAGSDYSAANFNSSRGSTVFLAPLHVTSGPVASAPVAVAIVSTETEMPPEEGPSPSPSPLSQAAPHP